MNNKETLQNYNNRLNANNITLDSILETINALPEAKEIVLQDKVIEITENGTITIMSDEGYNGLSSIKLTINVEGGATETPSEYIQDGLIAWFDGEDAPDENNHWVNKMGTDYIYETTGLSLWQDNNCYKNDKTLTMITSEDYYVEGYTIEVVGCINSATNSDGSTGGWFFCMNETGTFGIGVTDAEGNINFVNNGDTFDGKYSNYYGQTVGASLYLEDVVARGASGICSGKASVNGASWISFTETTSANGTKYTNHPILSYYVPSATSKGRYLADGFIHCIRIYNRQLTNAEVAYNHAVDKARFNL